MPPGSDQLTIAELVAPLRADPAGTAVMFDVDGTLAPIVARPQDAHVPESISVLLGRMCGHFGLVACVSGRGAAEARRLVGVGGATYAGAHGAELLEPGATASTVDPRAAKWRPVVRAFAASWDRPELRKLRLRIEDKDFIWAFHWRGAPDEEAAAELARRIAEDAAEVGLATHWGRKVLEVRPPVEFSKGHVVVDLLRRSRCRRALFAGDDVTDLDAFRSIGELLTRGDLTHAVRVGVISDEAPAELRDLTDIGVDGTDGVRELMRVLVA